MDINDTYITNDKPIIIIIKSDVFRGGTAWFTLKTNKDEDEDSEAILQKTAQIIQHSTEPGWDTVTINLFPSETELIEEGRYYYDFKLVSQDRLTVRTYLDNMIKFKLGVTRSY